MGHATLARGTSAYSRRSQASTLLIALAVVLLAAAAPAAKSVKEPPVAGASVDQQEWKALLLRMRALQLEYQLATADKRTGLEADYARLVSRGEVLAAGLQAQLEQ